MLADNDEALQYVDFAAWQQELREDELGRQGAAFWQALVRSHQVNHRLAFETPGHANARHQASRADRTLEALLSSDGGEARVLALWGAFLARISQQERLLIGLHVEGRNEDLADACGVFARALPVAFDQRQGASLDGLTDEMTTRLEQSRSWLDCLNEFDLGLCRYGFVHRPSAAEQSVLALDAEGRPSACAWC